MCGDGVQETLSWELRDLGLHPGPATNSLYDLLLFLGSVSPSVDQKAD